MDKPTPGEKTSRNTRSEGQKAAERIETGMGANRGGPAEVEVLRKTMLALAEDQRMDDVFDSLLPN